MFKNPAGPVSGASSSLQEVPQLRPPEVGLDDELALVGEALHAADDEVELLQLLHRVVDLAHVDLSRKARVGEVLAVVAEPPRQVAVRRQQLVQLEFLDRILYTCTGWDRSYVPMEKIL